MLIAIYIIYLLEKMSIQIFRLFLIRYFFIVDYEFFIYFSRDLILFWGVCLILSFLKLLSSQS